MQTVATRMLRHCSRFGSKGNYSAGVHTFPTTLSRRHRRRPGECLILFSRESSTLVSDTSWRMLNDAVQAGNGGHASEILDEIIQDYKSQLQNGLSKEKQGTNNTNGMLDIRIFSLALQAWKNSNSPSVQSAIQAQTLLGQMQSLVEKSVLRERPNLIDYITILECWDKAIVYRKDESVDPKILQHVEHVWNLMKEEEATGRGTLTEVSYRIFLSILAKAGQAERAEQVMEEYKQQKLLNSTNSRFSKSDEPVVTSTLSDLVLEAHIHNPERKSPERAEEFLQKIYDDPLISNPNAEMYNKVLEFWLSSEHRNYTIVADRVDHLILKMKAARIQPNLVSYQYAINAVARIGDSARAEAFLANLVKDYSSEFDADLKPDVQAFRSTIWAYTKTSSPDAAKQAESILENMKELSSSDFDTFPTISDYRLVMLCWARSFSIEAVEKTKTLYEEVMSLSSRNDDAPATDASLMNIVLNASSANEKAFQTEKLLWSFYDRHIKDPLNNPLPDTISFSIVIKSWSKSRDYDAPDRAVKLFQKLEELFSAGNDSCKPDLMIYCTLLQCWAKSKKKESPFKAESILRRLQNLARKGDQSFEPDTACWNSAISAWIGEGDRAESLFREMIETYQNNPDFAAEPNEITYAVTLNAWAKTKATSIASERAVALLRYIEKLYEDGIVSVKPNVVSYSCVMDCLAYARRPSAALQAESMLRQLAASGDADKKPNVITYNSVIKGWSFARHPEAVARVTALLKEMLELSKSDGDLRPNANTFGSILKAVADSNVPDKAERAEAVVSLMERFNCRDDKWIRTELQKCRGRGRSHDDSYQERTENGRRARRSRNREKVPSIGEYKSKG